MRYSFSELLIKYPLSNIIMKKLLLFILLVFTTCITNAQNFDSNYLDGRVWFKVKKSVTNSNQRKATDQSFPTVGEIGQVPLEIRRLPIFSSNRSNHKVYKFETAAKIKPELFPDLFYVDFNQTSPNESDQIIAQLLQSGLVEIAEKEPIFRSSLAPDDTHLNNQWALAKVNAEAAWDLVKDFPFMTNGSPIIIAVVDDAININHEDLTDVIWINEGEIPDNGIDDDGNGYIDDYKGVDVSKETTSAMPPTNAFSHGTHVAGIAGAKSNNNKGVASLAYNAKIMAIKATTQSGYVNYGYSGIIYAIENGAHIINCSWGGTSSSQVLQDIIDLATANNIIVVGAAGNSSLDELTYPASYNGVISVANINQNDIVHPTSTHSSRVNISAPGVSIYSTGVNLGYENKTGTSMAAPMVSSLLSLMKSVDPTIPNNLILGCLTSSAVNIEDLNPTYVGKIGAGRIDAYEALSCVLDLTESPPVANFAASIQSIHTGASVQYTNFSGFSPTSFEWTFEGGTPSTYSGPTPPSIVYNTAGTYDVTLTVTNDYGTHTLTRNDFIVVTAGVDCEPKNLDSVWNWAIYTASSNPNSWMVGTNPSRMIEEKAMYFDFSYSAATHITRTVLEFYSTSMNISNNAVIPLKIYDGSNGIPGAVLYIDSSLTYSDIIDDLNNGRQSVYLHPKAIPLPQSKKVFISIDFTSLCNTGDCTDDLTLIATLQGQSINNSPWEKKDGSWLQFGQGGSFSYSGNLSIFPYITANPFRFDFTIPAAVCLEQVANFDGSNINATGSWSVWFDNDTENSILNNLEISKAFSSTGTHTININAVGGACLDERINTQTFVVKDTPTITHQVISPLVCSGYSSDFLVEGADTYHWTAPAYIVGYDKEELSVVLNNTEDLTVVGSKEGCSSTYTFNVPVTESLATSVVLNSTTNIYEPNVAVTFTTSGNNLGHSPVYTFYLNDVEIQKGSETSYTLTNPQLGDKVNVTASNISGCVITQMPVSNAIVLTMITLPIYFEYFNAKAENHYNEINWKLSDNQEGAQLILEKSSDGVNFKEIANYDFVIGKNFTMRDNDISGLSFYRIKSVNLDGSIEVSNALKIQRQWNDPITVYPSLVQSNQSVNIQLNDNGKNNYKIEILNSTGQILGTNYTRNNLSIPINTHSKGMHFIRVTNQSNGIVTIKKIMVQ